MATLHVRNVPDRLYERLRQQAAAESRSLSAGEVALLEQVLGEPEAGRAGLFRELASGGARLRV